MKSRRKVVILLSFAMLCIAAWGILREDKRPSAMVDEAVVAAMEEDAGEEAGEEVEEKVETPSIRLREEKQKRMRLFLERSRALRERSRQMSGGASENHVVLNVEPPQEEQEEGPSPDPEAAFEAAMEAELVGVRPEGTERLNALQREKVRKLRETIRSFKVDLPREE